MRLTGNVECENGTRVRIFGLKQDITAERMLWERTRFLAETDMLTGLANRSLFQARLASLDAAMAGPSGIGALLLIDLDGFKPVNDTFGHAAGDACLREVAARLTTVCREADLVARIMVARVVRALGCPTGQGPLIGDPRPAAQAAAWLAPADAVTRVA